MRAPTLFSFTLSILLSFTCWLSACLFSYSSFPLSFLPPISFKNHNMNSGVTCAERHSIVNLPNIVSSYSLTCHPLFIFYYHIIILYCFDFILTCLVSVSLHKQTSSVSFTINCSAT